MTNTIEQTKREMYRSFIDLQRQLIQENIPSLALGKCVSMGQFEAALEAHLEELRKAMVTINESTVRCTQASAGTFVDLAARVATLTEERDELRNKLQAQQMASATSADVIRGLREELQSLRMERAVLGSTSGPRLQENASGERTDAYTLGFNGAGKCSNPFAINTIERLHWNDGANDALRCSVVVDPAQIERNRKAAIAQVEGFRSGQVCGSNGSAYP